MADLFDKISGFEWDEGNIDKNLIAHEVEGWECEQVFFNEPLLLGDDRLHSTLEKRKFAFGATDAGRPLMIAFTVRRDLIRVISARDMTLKERKFHEKNI